ncbi:hypothetical protein O3P69_018459 [Scylla paramamosain]|uniref:DNA-(apurinic or apyrimidinic site) lyase n=1 Tax=Scylla paramamosain TaxID=85552 RepID=A0AAW0T338_SCYPA
MPEGPELHLAARFITTIGQRTLFGGQVVKSAVSTKNPDVAWDREVYRVRASSRGKELKVVLTEGEDEVKGGETLSILFRFGMSGNFKYTPVSDLPKHAHLQFYTINELTPMVLSFVDYRRFGRWEVEGDWGADRGPDPIREYQAFRSNVMENLKSSAFNRPICEAMLNQKFFNGIGNYLRAEILYRCGVRPFDEAREVLSELKPFSKWYESQVKQEDVKENIVKQEDVQKIVVKQEDNKESIVKQEDVKENIVKQEDVQKIVVKQQGNKESTVKLEGVKKSKMKPDLLDLCHILPKEVVNLEGGGKGYNVDPSADEEEYAAFREWLQCYYQDGMKNMVDHNGRTMWFSGEPGRLKPKDASSRNKIVRTKKMHKKQENKREAEEQNPDSGYEENNTKTKKRHSRAKTDSAVETKKAPPRKTPPKKTPAKKAMNGQTGKTTKGAKRVKQVKVKEEEAATPTLASKIKMKLEEANTVPRRRSVRLSRHQ